MEFLLFWILWMVIGGVIGHAKGRVSSGLVWSFLFGPIGCIIVACLPNLIKQREELEHKQILMNQMQVQQAQLDIQLQQLQQLRHSTQAPSPLSKTYRIAKNGEEIGEMSVSRIKLLLKSGHLTTQDYVFDQQINDWLTVDCIEELRSYRPIEGVRNAGSGRGLEPPTPRNLDNVTSVHGCRSCHTSPQTGVYCSDCGQPLSQSRRDREPASEPASGSACFQCGTPTSNRSGLCLRCWKRAQPNAHRGASSM